MCTTPNFYCMFCTYTVYKRHLKSRKNCFNVTKKYKHSNANQSLGHRNAVFKESAIYLKGCLSMKPIHWFFLFKSFTTSLPHLQAIPKQKQGSMTCYS